MNIVLTQNSKFRPYSFEEQLKPFLMATKEYRAIEEGLNELSTKSKLYERMANEDPNSQIGKMYRASSEDLSSQVDLLAREGLTPASRSALLGMKSKYSENIAPIEDAYKRYGESNKYRQAIMSKDSTAMFLNRPTIDDFLYGNTPDETYVSGKDLMARAASEAEIAATTVFQEQLAKGKTRTEALEAVRAMNDERLSGIVSREIAGIEGFNNLSQLEQAQLADYINKGVYAGMGNLAKGEYQTRQQEESLRLQRRQLALQEANSKANLWESGFNSDGSVNMKSPVWTAKGIEFSKDGTPKLVPKPKASASGSSGSKGKTSTEKVYQMSDGNTLKVREDNVSTLVLKDGTSYEGNVLNYENLDANTKKAFSALHPEAHLFFKTKKGEVIPVPLHQLTNVAEQEPLFENQEVKL